MSFRLLLLYCAAACLSACQNFSAVTDTSEPPVFTPGTGLRAPASVGCETMIESFCEALYSPQAKGNLRVGSGSQRHDVFQGHTDNDFKAPIYFYNSVKLRRREHLPSDFRRLLEKQNYFSYLREFVSRPARDKMTLAERLEDVRQNHRLQSMWEAAKEETLLLRMRKLNPLFHNVRDEMIPLEDGWQLDRTRRHLINEIAISLWSGHENWKKVESSFTEIRDQMLAVVQELDVPDDVRWRWSKRLSAVTLVLPGSMPEIADEDCASTEANAYYYPRLNVITVCAGDFNSEDIYQTLAHELSHAVDAGSQAYAFVMQSRLAVELTPLREQSCRKQPLDCNQWARFKERVTDRIHDWLEFRHDVPEFQSCLQTQKPSKELNETALDTIAKREVNRAIASLADAHVFLRLTKEKLPYADGTWRKNPVYLNACRSDEVTLNHMFENDELARVFFVNEYQCSGDSPDRLRHAIETAREFTTSVSKGVMRVEGALSGNDGLVIGGYASPPDERFADVLGSYTFARILTATGDLASRRSLYLASSSWQCSPPSLAQHFPDEARIERQFSFGAHAFGIDRRRENMSTPMRGILQCSKDFEFEECRLPFRDEAKPALTSVPSDESPKAPKPTQASVSDLRAEDEPTPPGNAGTPAADSQ